MTTWDIQIWTSLLKHNLDCAKFYKGWKAIKKLLGHAHGARPGRREAFKLLENDYDMPDTVVCNLHVLN